MKKVINKISTMTEEELREVMRAIEARYAQAYPQWDVVYIALHKDPSLRIQEFANLLDMVGQDLSSLLP